MSSIWREAVDPASGRSYYYHLVTRETTWERPLALSGSEEGPELRGDGGRGVDTAGKAGGDEEGRGAEEAGGPEEDAGDDTNGSRQADGAVSRLLQTFSNLRAKFEVEFANVICAVNGLQQFKMLLSGALGPAARCQCVSLLIGGCEAGSAEALCSADVPALLMDIIMAPDDDDGVQSMTRLQALHVLCKLSCQASTHPMLKHQVDWVKLARSRGVAGGGGYGSQSRGFEREWNLRVCMSLCVVLAGPCGKDLEGPCLAPVRERIQRLLGSECGEAALLPLPVDGHDVSTFHLLLRGAGAGDRGEDMLKFLAWYLTLLCKDFDEAERFTAGGGTGLLQSLCLDRSDSVRRLATQLLLDLLQKHQSVGVQVLDSWVGLAGDLPLGLFGSSPAEMLRSSGGLEMMMMMPGGGVEGAEEGGKAGQQQARDLGVADTFLKVGRVRTPVHRAIMVGRSWLLRDQILQRPEDLIFSLDGLVPEQLLSTVLVYLYTGVPILPGDAGSVVELLQSASRLHMPGLVATCEKVLHGHITLSTVQKVLEAAEGCGLESLQASCKAFLQMSSHLQSRQGGVSTTTTTNASSACSSPQRPPAAVALSSEGATASASPARSDRAVALSPQAASSPIRRRPASPVSSLSASDNRRPLSPGHHAQWSADEGGTPTRAAEPMGHGSIYHKLMSTHAGAEGSSRPVQQSATIPGCEAYESTLQDLMAEVAATLPTPPAKQRGRPERAANSRRVERRPGQAPVELFVESVHSLRPPDPKPDDRQRRAEMRALPKHLHAAPRRKPPPTADQQAADESRPSGSSQGEGRRRRRLPSEEQHEGAKEDEASAAAVIKDKLKLLKSRTGRSTTSTLLLTCQSVDTGLRAREESRGGEKVTRPPTAQPDDERGGGLDDSMASTTTAGSSCLRRSGCGCQGCRPAATTHPTTAPSKAADREFYSEEAQEAAKRRLKSKNAALLQRRRAEQEASAAVKTPSKWRQDSANFRAVIRAARGLATTEGDAVAFTAAAPDPSLTACPHCRRSFNKQAAERHIPRCRDIVAKPTRLMKGGGRGAASGHSVKAIDNHRQQQQQQQQQVSRSYSTSTWRL